MFILSVFAFLAGIATVLSPCVLPILPALLAGGVGGGRWRPLGIVAGLSFSFIFFTLSLTWLVRLTGVSADYLRYVAIAVLFLFGLVMVVPMLSVRFATLAGGIAVAGSRVQAKVFGRDFAGGFVLGTALGLLWTPCAGPILAAVVSLIATQTVSLSALILIAFYTFGAALPMLLIAYGGHYVVSSSRWLSTHSEWIRQVFGVLMIATAVAMALRWDFVIQQRLTASLPSFLPDDNAVVEQELRALRDSDRKTYRAMNDLGPAPELMGVVNWINSPPLSLAQLRGKVVLIDFWTYSCINCLRTLPYLEKWDAEYRDKGLVIIGVHTPEFEFEKSPENVASAAMTLGVTYPVAQDNNYVVWDAYDNHYWPAHYLIDQSGHIRMIHFGEGAYAETEAVIRQLLGLPPLVGTAEPKVAKRSISPETYLGLERGNSYLKEVALQPYKVVTYAYSFPLALNQVALKGNWEAEPQKITARGDDSYLDMMFLGRRAYLVLSGQSSTPLEVTLDGKKVAEFIVDSDRKYDIANTEYGVHSLSLKVPNGVSAYAFTFGDE